MTPSIPTKLKFGDRVCTVVSDNVVTLLKQWQPDLPRNRKIPLEEVEKKQARLRAVQVILQDLHWTNGYTLEMADWPDARLWDLWSAIPSHCVKTRKALARYLERSPLIKLAECAE